MTFHPNVAALPRDALGLRCGGSSGRVERGIIPATVDADVDVATLFPAMAAPLLTFVLLLPVTVGPLPLAALPLPIASNPNPTTTLPELLGARWRWCFAWPDVDNEVSSDLRADWRSLTVVADVRIGSGR
jgi:hypothetical protein